MRQLPPPGDGEPVETNGEEQNEDGSEGEVRERKAEKADEAEGAVVPAIAAGGRAHSGGNGEQDGDGECGKGQRKGGGIGLRDELADRFVEAQRAAEIAVEDAIPIADVLGGERNVEAIGVARGLDVGTGSAFAEHGLDGVSGDEVDEQKDHADDQPDDRQHVGEAGKEIANHASRFPSSWRRRNQRRRRPGGDRL